MSESDRTGYRESPDTTDGPVGRPQEGDGDRLQDAGAPADEDATTLTTDDEAQTEDSLARPGNASD
ncbi:MAG: hypothetical protein JWQ45_721 [Blastococcus sp.]|nr:hypothetical protein [Blastococcus sp.]